MPYLDDICTACVEKEYNLLFYYSEYQNSAHGTNYFLCVVIRDCYWKLKKLQLSHVNNRPRDVSKLDRIGEQSNKTLISFCKRGIFFPTHSKQLIKLILIDGYADIR
jgi:hypothetical protein